MLENQVTKLVFKKWFGGGGGGGSVGLNRGFTSYSISYNLFLN